VAKVLNVAIFTPCACQRARRNLQLGHGYLKMVLVDLDGSPMLDTAAHKAGPGSPACMARMAVQAGRRCGVMRRPFPFNETTPTTSKKVMSKQASYYAALFGQQVGGAIA
jgi:hypothetical protein